MFLHRQRGLVCILAWAGAAFAASPTQRFDGEWSAVLSCPNSSGALGYSFELLAVVREGVLHAEKGRRGEPGWLQIDGRVDPDGRGNLYADGLVGASEVAVGHRPAGSPYGYHLAVEFKDTTGTGNRVEGRPCTIAFGRK